MDPARTLRRGRGGANGDDPAHLHRAQGPRRVRRQDRRLDPIRTIPLSAAALAAYQAQRRRSPDSPLVFPAPRGGYLNLRNWRNRDWHPALGAAGVAPRGPNALRHTFATWFLLHSDDRWLLAKLMGTGIDMIEQHYGHMLAPHATKSRDILDAIWDGFGRKLDATTRPAHPAHTPIPLNQAENSEAL